MADTTFDLPIYTVDAFTDEPFKGNQAAVCLVPKDKELGDELLQKIASEMNLSETAYIQHLSDDSNFTVNNKFRLRWFTPTNEVPLCGHATLASAAVLFFCANNSSDTITFMSKSGPLLARKADSGITLDFPLNPVQDYDRARALPIVKEICFPVQVSDIKYSPTTKKLLLRLDDGLSREDLEKLGPDGNSLHAADPSGHVMGVIVTVRARPENTDKTGRCYDFFSRYFAPWNGIAEDAVTGSAHTVLADYWRSQLGKATFYARQCSRRGGDLDVKIVGDRVELTGQARVVLQGNLKL